MPLGIKNKALKEQILKNQRKRALQIAANRGEILKTKTLRGTHKKKVNIISTKTIEKIIKERKKEFIKKTKNRKSKSK